MHNTFYTIFTTEGVGKIITQYQFSSILLNLSIKSAGISMVCKLSTPISSSVLKTRSTIP